MSHEDCPNWGLAANMGARIAVGLLCLMLGACNSLLGISTPVDLPSDAATESLVTLVPDASPDRADARPDGAGASSDGPDAGPDGTDARSDGADGGSEGADAAPDGADARSDADPADTSPPPPLVITPTTLPDARFNVAYSVKLTATGGTGLEQLWSITSGTLPAGMDLELDGTLQGVPLEEGTFTVEVTVAEVRGTSHGTEQLMLTVVRKHWLAYLANPEQSNSFGIFAINVRSPSVQMKVSSNVPAVSGRVDKFHFSADGKYIAYVAFLATGPNLYVVDMTGEQPGTPRKVNEYGGVDDFAWSADGRYLAFDDVNDQGTTAILVADMTQPQSHPVQAATGTGNINEIGFVTDDLLTYWLDNLDFARRSTNGIFGAAQLLTVYGSLVQRWPDLESALFASNGESCEDPTWNLIDFRSPLTMRQLVGYVSASPGRDFIAHRENSSPYRYNIYSTWGTDPLSSFPSASHFCSPGGWSHDGKLFVAGGDDDTLQITTIDGATATTSPLPGNYGTVAENGPPTFSPDDHWLGFSTNQGAFVVRNNHGSLGAAIGGGVAVTQQFGQPRLAFSPDSTHLASGEASSMGRPASVRMTDLRLDPPATIEVGLGTAAGSGVDSLGWSVHSTEAAFVVRNGYFPSGSSMPTDLYLYLLPTSSPQSAPFIQNVTNFPSCDMYSIACGLVTNFEFQP